MNGRSDWVNLSFVFSKQIGRWWQDEAYVRDRLIYTCADEAMQEHRDGQGEDAAVDESYPGDREWKRIYAEAAARADAVPAAEREAAIKRIEAERRAKWDRQFQERQAEESKKAFADLFSFFLAAMFGPMDLLFFGLAIVTAFQVARGSYEAE